jgi:hypothetical protein
MKPFNLIVLVFAFAAMTVPLRASSSVCDSAAGNLVTNCGFETSDFTGWTESGNFEDNSVLSSAFYAYGGPHSGTFYAALGPVDADGTLSQTLSTSAGTDYTFAFYVASTGDNPSDFSAYWDGGAPLLSLTNPGSDAAYSLYTFSVTGTGSDTIQFNFMDAPGYIALDDVSVSPGGSPVPEPNTLSLLGLGLAAALLGRRWLFA